MDKRVRDGYKRFIVTGLEGFFPEGYLKQEETQFLLDRYIGLISSQATIDSLTKKIVKRLNNTYGLKVYELHVGGKKVADIESRKPLDDSELKELFEDKVKGLDLDSVQYEIKVKVKKEVTQSADIKWDDAELQELPSSILFSVSEEISTDPILVERSLIQAALGSESAKNVGGLDTYFVPRLDYERVLELKKKYGETYKARVGDVDRDLLDQLRGKDEVKWRYYDMELGQTRGGKPIHKVEFQLPEISGDRVYKVEVPGALKNIRSGDYTFDIKEVGSRRALLGFKEHGDNRVNDEVDTIRKDGLLPGQFKKFMDLLYDNFLQRIESWPMDKLFDRFLGGMYIGGKKVRNADEAEEVLEQRAGVKVTREQVGELVERRKEMDGRIRDFLTLDDSTGQFEARDVYHLLMDMDQSDNALVDKISSGFPPASDADKIKDLLFSRELVAYILDLMINEPGMAEADRLDRWIKRVYEELGRGALLDVPVLRPFFERALELLREGFDSGQKSKKNIIPGRSIDPHGESRALMDAFSEITFDTFKARMSELKVEIMRIIMSMAARKDPLIMKLVGKTRESHRAVAEDTRVLSEYLWDSEFEKADALLGKVSDDKVRDQLANKLRLLRGTDYKKQPDHAQNRIEFIVEKFMSDRMKSERSKTASMAFGYIMDLIERDTDYSPIVRSVASRVAV